MGLAHRIDEEWSRSKLRRIARALTFPRTREIVGRSRRGGLLLWWPLAVVALLVCASLRGYADNAGFPVHSAEVEEGLLGFLPTKSLQQTVYPLWPWFFQWAFVIVHASWFVVPWIAAAFVSWRGPERIGSLFRWWITLHAAVVLGFVLFPLEPPWMADEGVTRVIAVKLGGEVNDSNPLAAMPSLHVALPLVMSLWFFRERWTAPGLAMLAYAGIVGFEVVFSGEHYVVDVAGSVVFAGAIALLARFDWRRIPSGLKELLEKAASAARVHRPRPVPVPVQHRERGQTLIEMALVFPLIFVFIMFMVDFGIALDRREMVQHGVSEGARFGAVGNVSTDEIKEYTRNQSATLEESKITVCYVDENGDGIVGNAGDNIRVSGEYTYKFSVGGGEMLTAFGASVPSIDMSPSANARLETDVSGANKC